ncbi:hypothetical protein ACIRU3_40425 [Streptomyces sp. NPDC101151]|uniref:hypothetical protein n=1 Tax=Streptomyces sp. NPDC101151 TaxID=3366115 RepID=UPI00382B83EE
MNQHHPQQPQQPGWNHPQQPGQPQPGWGGPQQGWGAPQPPKKSSAGKILGFGCLGFVAVLVLVGVIAAAGGSGSKSNESNGSKDTNSAPQAEKPAVDANGGSDDKKNTDTEPEKKVVTFKVWGTAPAGALGPLDIGYGSDTDTRKGTFKNGTFEATLPLAKDAMYYTVNAQLQGSGDINCSVTVDGHTKKGHASGGYNICDAQLSSGLLGGWN